MDLGFANTEDGAAYARNVVALVCVNMEESATDARNVVDLVCVSTEEDKMHAGNVMTRRNFPSGLNKKEWSM